MPKKIDPKVKERCLQQMLEHVSEYPNPTAAAEIIAKRNGVGTETVRRLWVQSRSMVASVAVPPPRSSSRSGS